MNETIDTPARITNRTRAAILADNQWRTELERIAARRMEPFEELAALEAIAKGHREELRDVTWFCRVKR